MSWLWLFIAVMMLVVAYKVIVHAVYSQETRLKWMEFFALSTVMFTVISIVLLPIAAGGIASDHIGDLGGVLLTVSIWVLIGVTGKWWLGPLFEWADKHDNGYL